MKVVFIGSVQLSLAVLEEFLHLNENVLAVLSLKNNDKNADYCDMSSLCNDNNIPIRHVENINTKDNVEWIKSFSPDVIFSVGSSQIVGKDILSLASFGVIGYHPSKLPLNRGRHPIVWSLALGLKETASTYFFMDEKIDNGPILDQEIVKIDYKDSAYSLYSKIQSTATRQIKRIMKALKTNQYEKKIQDHDVANYWRKRSEKDGEIDFKMNSSSIYNLVRALSEPYVGAHLMYRGTKVKVWEVEEIVNIQNNVEFGKVIAVDNAGILVKCNDGAILIKRHSFEELPKLGEYIS